MAWTIPIATAIVPCPTSLTVPFAEATPIPRLIVVREPLSDPRLVVSCNTAKERFAAPDGAPARTEDDSVTEATVKFLETAPLALPVSVASDVASFATPISFDVEPVPEAAIEEAAPVAEI